MAARKRAWGCQRSHLNSGPLVSCSITLEEGLVEEVPSSAAIEAPYTAEEALTEPDTVGPRQSNVILFLQISATFKTNVFVFEDMLEGSPGALFYLLEFLLPGSSPWSSH